MYTPFFPRKMAKALSSTEPDFICEIFLSARFIVVCLVQILFAQFHILYTLSMDITIAR